VEDLEADPRPVGVSASTGYPAALRVRIGDWRVVYRIEEVRLLVLVLQIGHRREIYRGF
jgi:mRNA interferase RelE/StbE